MSSTNIYISVIKEVYVKPRWCAFQIRFDRSVYLFVYVDVYVSPQICPSYLKADLVVIKWNCQSVDDNT